MKAIRKAAALAAFTASSLAVVLMTGCGMGLTAAPSANSQYSVGGVVHGGQQPVSGAYVVLYATSSANYGGTPVLLGKTTTGASGGFTFGALATCPAGQYVYALAAGGNPNPSTYAQGTNNQALVLGAAVGSCSSLSAGTVITINEVTTAALAYALDGFMPAGGVGLDYTLVSGGNTTAGITTSSTNTRGLADAFANAANIVNSSSGAAYTTTPSNSYGVVPQSLLYSVADMLQGCVNASAANASACTDPTVGLLAQANPPAAVGVTAPTNTLQAAVDIASFPGNNVTSLVNNVMVSATNGAAFLPQLTKVPNDLSLGIAYNDPQLSSPLGMAIDASDNVWVSGSLNADLLEYSAKGAILSPTTTQTAGNGAAASVPAQSGWLAGQIYTTSSKGDNIRSMAFDPSGNLWMADGTQSAAQPTFNNLGLLEYKPSTKALTTVTYASIDGNTNTYAVAADKFGNVWTSTYKKSTCTTYTTTGTGDCALIEFEVGNSYTATATFGTGSYQSLSPDTKGGARSVVVDSSTGPGAGNVWTTDINAGFVGRFPTTLNNTGAAGASQTAQYISVGTTDTTYGLALDESSDPWVTGSTTGNLYLLDPTAGTVVGTYAATPAMVAPAYDVIDGNANVFVATNLAAGGSISAIQEYTTFNGVFIAPGAGYSPSAYGYTASTGAGVNATYTSGTGLLYAVSDIAVDKAGALWALGSGAYSATAPNPAALVQILGIAAPVDPVLADGNYAAKP